MARSRTKLAVGGVVVAAAVAYLGVAGVGSGWVYYLNVDEFVGSVEARAARARVHGVVGAEGIETRPAELYARFTLIGETERLPVEYHGPVPDLFAPGRQVVVEGSMRPEGVFGADVLMTKCASKYEARTEDAEGAGASP